jgi:MFS family permease
MFMVFAPIAPRLTERIGTKRMVAFGLFGGAIGLYILSTVHADSSYLHLAVGMVCMSGGMSMALPPATESIMGSVPKEKAGIGSAMNDTTPQSGGALGVAVLGSVLASGFSAELARRLPRLSLPPEGVRQANQSIGAALDYADRLGGKVGAALTEVVRDAWMHGARLSLLIGSIIVVGAAAFAYAMLPAHAPHHHLNVSELLPTPIVVDDDELDARARLDDEPGVPTT